MAVLGMHSLNTGAPQWNCFCEHQKGGGVHALIVWCPREGTIVGTTLVAWDLEPARGQSIWAMQLGALGGLCFSPPSCHE